MDILNEYKKIDELRNQVNDLVKENECIVFNSNQIKQNIENEKFTLECNSEKIHNNEDKIAKLYVNIRKIEEKLSVWRGEKQLGVAYVRLSKTGRDDFSRQLHTIYNSIFNIDSKHFQENKSAYKDDIINTELLNAINYCKMSEIGYIVVSEVSRLSRNVYVFEKICDLLKQYNLNVYSCDDMIFALNDDGTVNDGFRKKVAFAEMEAKIIHQRLEQGRKKYIDCGGKLGRPYGSGIKSKEKYESQYKSIIDCLKNDYSIRNTAKITGYSTSTVQRVKEMFDIKSSRDPEIVNEKNETVSDVVLF